MSRIVASLFLVAVYLMIPSTTNAAEPKVSTEVQSISQSNNQFAFDLYQQLRSEEGNLFFSPASISTALAMTYAGAEGDTEKEMVNVLRFKLPEDQIHSAFASLTATLNAPTKDAYELRVANRLWGQKGYGFLPQFLATTRKQYGAELAQVDYVNEADRARQEINLWVEEQTNNKIKDLIPQGALNELTRLVLTNAIYFKGKWEHQFDKKRTKDAPFTTSAGEKVEAPLMFQKERFKYGETGDLRLLEMPYKGDDLSMLILLPAVAEIAAADDAKDEAIKKDRKRIQGTWRVTALTVNGNKSKEEDARKITVVNDAKGTWNFRSGNKEISKGTSIFDPTKKPKTIDFTPTEGEAKGDHFLGIYER